MNQYTKQFKKMAKRIMILAYSRELSLSDITKYTKEPLKYAYLDQQQRMEDAYLHGDIVDSIEFYNMQANLYQSYLEQLHLDPQIVFLSFLRYQNKKQISIQKRLSRLTK
ncbi:hypothetical protein C1940_17465 (plasmid) [Lactiplantibacillus plantarum subsp. plantarum]|uniref:hypothetical protein n=1 Tax=Lactiplantibacillus plantarum TaxID=1590 RepID=UPI000CD33E22|nr:hypothetical protein [Lactiplantibacillus plantarum]AUV74240.1 hypothetical protein C1940_17465 [Lactiplantibacillus plantarum subsp. plantarum]